VRERASLAVEWSCNVVDVASDVVPLFGKAFNESAVDLQALVVSAPATCTASRV
jgi:hypothetical protein